MSTPITLGVDRFLESIASLSGERIALLTHAAGVTRKLVPTTVALYRLVGDKLVALFAPEHGIESAAPDASPIPSASHPQFGIPIYSLYGETRRPNRAMLSSVETIVVDLQDVGARFYTYVWTLVFVLEAAAESGIRVVVLDRPNPLGDKIRGPVLQPEFASFLGRFPIPIQHGMSIGELANMFNSLFGINATLEIVLMHGWRRTMSWEETGLSWVSPSPALNCLDAVRLYPGLCLIEGTNLSEGRGTALPFQVVGAPWIHDEIRLAEHLNASSLPGVCFRPTAFIPCEGKWAGQVCRGVQIHITNQKQLDALLVGLTLIASVQQLYPNQFAWLTTSPEGNKPHFDLLIGNADVRAMLEAGIPAKTICEAWYADEEKFANTREAFLLYTPFAS